MSEAADISLSAQTLKSTVAQFAMAAAGFAGTILFARVLGPTDFGGVYLLLATAKLADRPMNGWSLAAKKRVSEDDGVRPAAFGAQLLFDACWLAVVGLAAVLVGDWLRGYTGLDAAPLLLVVLLASESVYETLESLVQGRGQISAATWSDAVRSYLTLPIQIGFVLAFGAAGVVYGLAAASVLTFPLVIYYVAARPALPSADTVRSLWEYARYSIPTSALGTTYDRLDLLLLGVVLSQSAAAYYEVAWKLTFPATFVATLAGRGLMAKVSGQSTRDVGVGRDVSNTISFTSLLALPLFFGALALAGDLVVTVYGADFAPAAPLLVGLAAYRVVRSQSGPLLQAVNGLDRPDVTMRLSAAAIAVNLVLGVLLTLRFGPIGVVAATIVAEGVRYVGSAMLLRSEVADLSLVSRPMGEQVGASVAMFAVVSVAHANLPVRSWIDVGALVALGAAVYVGTLLGVSPQFRNTLESTVRESLASG